MCEFLPTPPFGHPSRKQEGNLILSVHAHQELFVALGSAHAF
jgi:hypothetical protein